MRLADPTEKLPEFAVDESRRVNPRKADGGPVAGTVVDVPAMGFATASVATLTGAVAGDDGISLENEWYRIAMDPATGGLASWYDKDQERELVSAAARGDSRNTSTKPSIRRLVGRRYSIST